MKLLTHSGLLSVSKHKKKQQKNKTGHYGFGNKCYNSASSYSQSQDSVDVWTLKNDFGKLNVTEEHPTENKLEEYNWSSRSAANKENLHNWSSVKKKKSRNKKFQAYSPKKVSVAVSWRAPPKRPPSPAPAPSRPSSNSFGLCLWFQYNNAWHFMAQVSFSAYKRRFKVDPFRGKQEAGERDTETAVRECLEESSQLFNVPAEVLEHQHCVGNVFHVRVCFDHPQDLHQVSTEFENNLSQLLNHPDPDMKLKQGIGETVSLAMPRAHQYTSHSMHLNQSSFHETKDVPASVPLANQVKNMLKTLKNKHTSPLAFPGVVFTRSVVKHSGMELVTYVGKPETTDDVRLRLRRQSTSADSLHPRPGPAAQSQWQYSPRFYQDYMNDRVAMEKQAWKRHLELWPEDA